MTQKSPISVWLLSIFTFGIYGLIWAYKIKEEANQKHNAGVPSLILAFIPIVQIWWAWKWCGGAEKLNGGKYSQVICLLLFFIPAGFGIFLHQGAFQEAAQRGGAARAA